MATAAFLRYWIHQNADKKVRRVSTSSPCSHEGSDLSSEDSEYSPQHTISCHSLLIDDQLDSDDEGDHGRETAMITSFTSATSRYSQSPAKSSKSDFKSDFKSDSKSDCSDCNSGSNSPVKSSDVAKGATDGAPGVVHSSHPRACINSTDTVYKLGTTDRLSNGLLNHRHEEVVMAEVEITPFSRSPSNVLDIQTMTIKGGRSDAPQSLSSCNGDQISSDKLSSIASQGYSDHIEVLDD